MVSARFSKLPKAIKIFMAVVGGAFLVVFLGLLFGLLVQFLWNAVVAEILSVPTITFWQAVGLFVLAKLFFGVGGGKSRYSGHKRKRHQHWHSKDKEESTTSLAEEDMEFATDTGFKKYWQEEGREAFEKFLSLRDENKNRDGES